MKLARVLAVLVVAALAAFLVWRLSRPEEPVAPPGSPPQGTLPPGAADWRPEGPGRPADPPAAPRAPDPQVGVEPPAEVVAVGTPTKPGQEVAVGLPWRAGTGRMRYEITDVSLDRDRANEGARNESQRTWRVTVEVVEGDGVSGARVRLTLDSLRDQILGPDGRIWDFDSVVGDVGGLLEDPLFGPGMRAMLPLVGKSVEFRLDANGRVVDVDGVDEWRRLYLDAAERLHPWVKLGAPSKTSVIATWQEYLFPVLGGGTMRAGEARPFLLRVPVLSPWDMLWKGTLDVTRDDPDAFRVEVTADPEIARGPGAETELSAGIAKIQAVAAPGTAYKAGWRFARTGTPGLLEARIDSKYEVWEARGGAPDARGEPQYDRTFRETVRRANIRRTHPLPAVK